uniref:Choline transporter-like protein n=1 Tax=Naja naja TaxID=35670 RepID=A0A8C6YDX3_NAJNA
MLKVYSNCLEALWCFKIWRKVTAWTQGDPRKVIYPTDSRGQFCGQKGTSNEQKPYLFYFNIMKCASPLVLLEFQCPTTQICVSKCPDRYITFLQASSIDHTATQELKYYQQFCVPEFTDLKKVSELNCWIVAVFFVNAQFSMQKLFQDFLSSSICRGLVISMVISLVFIVLLRFLAGIMIWVMIVLVILVLGYGIFHCYMEYAHLKGQTGSDVSLMELGFQTDFRVYLHLKQTWLAFMIILCIMEVIIILLLIFLRKRILIAVALIKETFSTSNITKLCPGAHCLFAFYGGETAYHQYLIVFQIFNTFMFFWLANFVIALGQVTLAGAFASYYWAFKKPDDMPAFPLFSSFGRALRYHTGSLAFGSLILAIIQVIRVILEYLDHKLKASDNMFAKFLLTCFKCCFWCLEKFIKFLNRNAYIMIAIYGTNFCTSARNAFSLLMRNIIRVAVLDKVTDFLFFLGKILIVGSVGILAFFFFTQRIKLIQDTAPTLNYYWVPILTVMVGSYLIAHGFFSVYAMCVDTLFLCFLEDLERNDGSTEKPYFMSSHLRKLLKKTNKQTDA